MKSPSPLCLQVLRHITLDNTPPICSRLSHRYYASLPAADKNRQPPRPPPRKFKPPPPPERPDVPPSPPPAIAIERPPSQPGFKLRQKQDDDSDHLPRPLSHPIGLPSPPLPGENTGLDKRTLQQKRDDFVDYDKHLAKRKQMTKQISKPYFRDWSNMRFEKGKTFVANERLFRGEHAMFFPNFFGRTLRKGGEKRYKRDGYGGLGRDTSEVMYGKITVVGLFSGDWAARQVDTFCSSKQNPAIQEILEQGKDVAQKVEINYENNLLKYWVLRLFGLGGLRSERSLEQQGRYFIVRRGLTDTIKESIGMLNDKVGYVYLVDPECRIRWAGSAVADEGEKQTMVKGLRRLILDARAAKEKPVLEEAVAEVVQEKRAAASAG